MTRSQISIVSIPTGLVESLSISYQVLPRSLCHGCSTLTVSGLYGGRMHAPKAVSAGYLHIRSAYGYGNLFLVMISRQVLMIMNMMIVLILAILSSFSLWFPVTDDYSSTSYCLEGFSIIKQSFTHTAIVRINLHVGVSCRSKHN